VKQHHGIAELIASATAGWSVAPGQRPELLDHARQALAATANLDQPLSDVKVVVPQAKAHDQLISELRKVIAGSTEDPPALAYIRTTATADVRNPLGSPAWSSDLQKEQEYHLEMRHLHNLNLYGTGRVVGLELSVPACTSHPSVVVSPGVAIDSAGRELILRTAIELPICDSCSPKYTAIHSKKDRDGGTAEDILKGGGVANCLSICLVAETEIGDDLTIGKLELGPSGWFVDSTFP
jgi:hypothetical protein